MAIKTFVAVDQSTIWDVVNNTYGSVNFIVKLMQDNNFPNVNTYPKNGQQFIYDDTLVLNQNTQQVNSSNRKFATRNRTSTNSNNMIRYETVLSTEYTSNADGTTLVVLPSLALIGARLISVEKEIQPIKAANFSWNTTSGQLSLLNGTTVDADQTLFILYAITITA